MTIKDEMAKFTSGLKEAPAVPTKRAGSVLTAPVALMAMNAGYLELQEEVQRLKQTAGTPARIRLDLCDDGPYHATPVDPERVANLKANLKENGQSSPALLRPKPDGRFEIVAGRHRKAALLELGYEEWDAFVKPLDEDQAERHTFYDNLLAPALTDYARYMGLSRRKASKGFTDQQLAEESGCLSRPTVTRLLSFQNLPERALSVIAAMPSKFSRTVSGNLVMELVKLGPEHEQRLVEALEQVGSGSLAASDLLKRVSKTAEAPARGSASTDVRTIRVGKATFAKVTRREGKVVVDFADKEHAASLEAAIADLVEAHSRKVASTTKAP